MTPSRYRRATARTAARTAKIQAQTAIPTASRRPTPRDALRYWAASMEGLRREDAAGPGRGEAASEESPHDSVGAVVTACCRSNSRPR